MWLCRSWLAWSKVTQVLYQRQILQSGTRKGDCNEQVFCLDSVEPWSGHCCLFFPRDEAGQQARVGKFLCVVYVCVCVCVCVLCMCVCVVYVCVRVCVVCVCVCCVYVCVCVCCVCVCVCVHACMCSCVHACVIIKVLGMVHNGYDPLKLHCYPLGFQQPSYMPP